MRLRILESAKEDLIEGYHFYEEQTPGLGAYFLDLLFADIDSLVVYAGIHSKVNGHAEFSRSVFHSPSTTTSISTKFKSTPCLIADADHPGSATD